MIAINNVSFAYKDKTVINDLTLKINKGQHICLFGESGSGKTTLLRLIMGLEKPSGGSITADKAVFSAVFQEDRLLPFKTVLENLTLVGADREEAIYHLNALNIGQAANKYPRKLSGGMSRRAAIARALCADYNVLVLDEPFSGLDRENTENAARHILSSVKDRTLIAVTHSHEESRLLNAETVNIT